MLKRDRLHLALALISVLVLGVALWRERASTSTSTSSGSDATGRAHESVTVPRLLRAIPKDAPLLFTLDLEAPHTDGLRALLFNPAHELAGVGRLQEVCGYDPSPRVKALAVAAFRPSESDPSGPAFAVVAGGDFEMPRLAVCIERLIETRGGRAERHRSGSITLIRDQHGTDTEIALLDQGLVLVSTRQHLRQLLQALDGEAPNVGDDPTHRSLRAAVGGQAPVIGTLAFQRGWLTQLFTDEDAERSPLAHLRAAALRLDLGDDVALDALLRCERAADVAPLQRFLNELRGKISPALRDQGLAALDRFEFEPQGQDLRLRWKLDENTLEQLIQRLNQPLKAPPAPSAAPPMPVEELIPAKPQP